jgi:hypothetical protein
VGGWVGQAFPVKEDARLAAGRGRFLNDVGPGRLLHVAMLRSPRWIDVVVMERLL